MSEVKVPNVTFNNGQQYPVLGLGTWKSTPGQVSDAVKWAIDAGYRHFDCAHIYHNEREVGNALREKINQGVVKREELYITSKLWNSYHRTDLVIPALRKTLENLGLDYLDLYLIHFPFAFKEGDELFLEEEDKNIFSDVDYLDTWVGMEECVKTGLAKSIGVSNFNSLQLTRLLDVAKIKPVVNQIECHPYLNQKKMMEFCKLRNIVVTAYSPLGSPDRPGAKPGAPQLMEDPKLKEVATKYGKTTAQVLIRYQVQRGNMVIPKSATKSRIEQNINIFDFELSAEDMAYIDTLDCGGRVIQFNSAKTHKDWPFSIEF